MNGYMEIDYAGRWWMPSRHPTILGNVRYDLGKQEEASRSTERSFLPIQETGLTQTLQAFIDQGRIGAGQPQFEGQRVAPLGPGQQAAISGAEPFLDTFSAQREIPFLGETGGALQGILSGEFGGELISPERAQQVFEQTRQIPRLRQFERFDKPLIEEQFAGPGFQSTARARAVTLGAEELGRDIASEREQFLFGTEQANRALQEARAGRTLSGIPLGLEAGLQPERVAGARLAGRAGVFDFLTTQQQQQQREIAAEREIFTEAQRFMDPEDFANLVTLLGLNFSTSKSTSSFESPLSQGFGSLLSGGGAVAGANIAGPTSTSIGTGLQTGLFG